MNILNNRDPIMEPCGIPSLISDHLMWDESTFDRCLRELKVQSCKLYKNKYMIASTQITNTEIFAFVAVLLLTLLGRKVLL